MTRPSRLILARRFVETLVFAVAGGAVLGLPGLPAGWLSGAILFVAGTFPLDAVADAYVRFQAGSKLGKIVLEI